MSWLLAPGDQSIRAWVSASVFAMNIQGCFPLGLTGLISLLSKGPSRVLTTIQKAPILWCSAFFVVHLSHPYMINGKTIALTVQIFVGKVMSLLFNALSRFVIAFLPRSKRLLISWLQSPSTAILEIKSVTVSTFSPSTIYLPWNDGTRCHDLSFWNVDF